MNREEQGTLRAGKLTGSRVQRIMTGTYKAWNSVAHEMRNPRPFFSVEDAPNMPEALKWGQLTEPQACARFWEKHPEFEIANPMFLNWHDPKQTELHKYLAYSPDRMLMRPIGDAYVAGLEVKCPYNGEVHAETIRQNRLLEKYKWQVYHGMYVAGLEEWWFTSFDPRVTDKDYEFFELHVHAERSDMLRLKSTITQFLDGFTSGQEFQPPSRKAADYNRMF